MCVIGKVFYRVWLISRINVFGLVCVSYGAKTKHSVNNLLYGVSTKACDESFVVGVIRNDTLASGKHVGLNLSKAAKLLK
jgi:hypothetical protein